MGWKPGYKRKKKQQRPEWKTMHRHDVHERLMSDEDLKALKALIPQDTRDLTGRLMGDPIPGDRRRA